MVLKEGYKMMNQFLIENTYKERISSLKRNFGRIWQKQEKRKFQTSEFFFRQEKMVKNANLGVRRGVIMELNGNSIR